MFVLNFPQLTHQKKSAKISFLFVKAQYIAQNERACTIEVVLGWGGGTVIHAKTRKNRGYCIRTLVSTHIVHRQMQKLRFWVIFTTFSVGNICTFLIECRFQTEYGKKTCGF